MNASRSSLLDEGPGWLSNADGSFKVHEIERDVIPPPEFHPLLPLGLPVPISRESLDGVRYGGENLSIVPPQEYAFNALNLNTEVVFKPINLTDRSRLVPLGRHYDRLKKLSGKESDLMPLDPWAFRLLLAHRPVNLARPLQPYRIQQQVMILLVGEFSSFKHVVWHCHWPKNGIPFGYYEMLSANACFSQAMTGPILVPCVPRDAVSVVRFA